MSEHGRTPAPGVLARRRAQARRLTRRSALLTVVSALVPGAGLLPTRYRPLGRLLVGLAVLLALVGLALVLTGRAGPALVRLALDGNALLLLALALVFATLLWIFAVVLTHRGTDEPGIESGQRWGLRVLTGLLCVALVGPIGSVVRDALVQRTLLATLFPDRRSPGSATGTGQPHDGADPWSGVERVTVLLLGTAVDDPQTGLRVDSMTVASIDPGTGDLLLVGLPPALRTVPFPPANPLAKLYPHGFSCAAGCPLEAVWAEAVTHKDLFKNDRNPGLTTTRGVVEQLTGLPVDNTVILDQAALHDLVDAVGGVVVPVAVDLPIGGRLGADGPPAQVSDVVEWLRPGGRRLDGVQATWFARSRATTDADRLQRQRCLALDLVARATPGVLARAYPRLATVLEGAVTTDVAAADLPAWAELVGRVRSGRTRSLALPSTSDGAQAQAAVRAALTAPADQGTTTVTAGC